MNELKQIPITHVYGSLGGILKDEPNYFPFGSDKSVKIDLYNEAANRISTLHEFINSDTDQQIKTTLAYAEKIYFLGFGYHKENMKLLNLKNSSNNTIIGTSFGFNEREKSGLIKRYPFIKSLEIEKNLDFIKNFVSL